MKPLNGQFLRQTREVADSKSWAWLKSRNLKEETEGFLIAAQDRALRTNVIKVKIDKQEGDVRCRMFKDRDETVAHLTSESSKLEQLEYKCINEGLMHVAAWYRGTHGPKFTKFREQVSIGQTPNAAKFRCATTRSVLDIRYRKFVLPQKWTKVHQNSRRPATHKCPSSCQISSRSVKRCT